MKLDSISVGGGLALVAVAFLANAAASLFGSTDRTAHADDLKRASKSQPVADVPATLADGGGMLQATDGAPQTMPMGGTGSCFVEDQPLDWFGAIRVLTDCFDPSTTLGARVPAVSAQIVDVNADGTSEAFAFGSESPHITILSAFGESATCVLYQQHSVSNDGQLVFHESCVLPSAPFVRLALEQQWVPNPNYADLQFYGWRDFDGDDDQDLLFYFRVGIANPPTGEGAQESGRYIWVENTGFEATRPLTGDLDGDGSVGASDLTMLLGGWTGN